MRRYFCAVIAIGLLSLSAVAFAQGVASDKSSEDGVPKPAAGSPDAGSPDGADSGSKAALDAATGNQRRRLPRTSKGLAPILQDQSKSTITPGDVAGRTLLGPIAKWVYTINVVDAAAIKACKADVAVIDYSADGSQGRAFTRQQVEDMRVKSDGSRMKIVAYMSIGEAEDYRDLYFRPEWLTGRRPPWLGPLNQGWARNYKVRYWDKAWQRLIFGQPDAYLDRLIAAGFDGAYLDIIDAYEYWQDNSSPDGPRPSAAEDMIAFVGALSRYAWEKSPGFMIIPQNGEGLLRSATYRAHISAIATESVYYRGITPPPDEKRRDDVEKNFPADTQRRLADLDFAIADHIPVMAVEYLMDEPEDIVEAPKIAPVMRKRGLVPHFSVRQLDKLHCEPIN